MIIPRGDPQKVRKVLLATFPSVQSFRDFEADARNLPDLEPAISHFICYAWEEGVLEEETRDAFVKFLTRYGKDYEEIPPELLTFGELLEDIAPRSINALIDEAFDEITETFQIPKIQASMVTRLRKNFNPNTPKKRGLLRIVAFWIAGNRPDIEWDYERLLKLPRTPDEMKRVKETEGIDIAFHLQGEIIGTEAVQWLKDELPQCLDDLHLSGHINWRNIHPTSVTSISLRIPKKRGESGESRLYNQAIRDSLALAHQIAVRWLLSDHSNPQREIIIGIFAGPFAEANSFLHPLFKAQLSSDSNIFLSDFAHLCAKIAEVKVIFERSATPLDVGAGRVVHFWPVKYFCSNPYYDFVPLLLHDDMLPTTEQSYRQFQYDLYFPKEGYGTTTFGALRTLYKFPQNPLLVMEIAKVLLSRRMFYEADTILAHILRIYPHHIVARTMRMMIYLNIALGQQEFRHAELTFDRAIAEGKHLTSYCTDNEEVWCEFGLVYIGRAVKYWMLLREGRETDPEKVAIMQEHIIPYLQKAEEYFLQGMTISPSGQDNRNLYWLQYSRGLLELLTGNAALFDKTERANIKDQQYCFRNVGIQLYCLMGWIREDVSINDEAFKQISDLAARTVVNALLSIIGVYENSVLLRSYLPNIKLSFCCIWDFAPHLTIRACKQVLTWLEEARDEAQKLEKDNIAIYSIAHCLAQYHSPDEFIECLNITIDTVKRLISEDLLHKDDNMLLPDEIQKEVSKVKIMLLHIDKGIETGVLFQKYGFQDEKPPKPL